MEMPEVPPEKTDLVINPESIKQDDLLVVNEEESKPQTADDE